MKILVEIDDGKLNHHIKLCCSNLETERINCCLVCPFEDIICKIPGMKRLFVAARNRAK